MRISIQNTAKRVAVKGYHYRDRWIHVLFDVETENFLCSFMDGGREIVVFINNGDDVKKAIRIGVDEYFALIGEEEFADQPKVNHTPEEFDYR